MHLNDFCLLMTQAFQNTLKNWSCTQLCWFRLSACYCKSNEKNQQQLPNQPTNPLSSPGLLTDRGWGLEEWIHNNFVENDPGGERVYGSKEKTKTQVIKKETSFPVAE